MWRRIADSATKAIAIVANERGELSWFDREIDVIERGVTIEVRERHVLEFNLAFELRRLLRAR